MAQLAPLLPEKPPEPVKKTVAELFAEYCEKGRSDRAYMTIRKQDKEAAKVTQHFGDTTLG